MGNYAFAATATVIKQGSFEFRGNVLLRYLGRTADLNIPYTAVVPYTIAGRAITSIGANAFAGLNFIETIKVPDIVTGIGTSAFADMQAAIYLMPGRTHIQNGFFQGTGARRVIIPHGVTDIGANAFAGFLGEEVVLPSTVTRIGNSAFLRAAALRSIALPDSLHYIERQAFDGTTFTSVTIPASVKTIGVQAFARNTHLQEVRILRTAEAGAVFPLAADAFLNTHANLRFIVPHCSLSVYQTAPVWSNHLNRITTDPLTVAVNAPQNMTVHVRGRQSFTQYVYFEGTDDIEAAVELIENEGLRISVYNRLGALVASGEGVSFRAAAGSRYRVVISNPSLALHRNAYLRVLAQAAQSEAPIPEFLRLRTGARLGSVLSPSWQVYLINDNHFDVSVTYNQRFCFQSDAREFTNLRHLRTVTVPAASRLQVIIDSNGVATFITAAVNFTRCGQSYRRITYANGLLANIYLNNRRNEISV